MMHAPLSRSPGERSKHMSKPQLFEIKLSEEQEDAMTIEQVMQIVEAEE